MASRSWWRGAGRTLTVVSSLALLTATLAQATPPNHGGRPQVGGRAIGLRPQPLYGPAGPTPLNPAGPTPLNPAGPTPLNPAGPPPLGAGAAFPRHFVPYQQPRMYVGVVGGYGQAGSFYCQVHNRGYASQGLFLNHLAEADGMYGDEALSYLIEDGGVWVFPAQ